MKNNRMFFEDEKVQIKFNFKYLIRILRYAFPYKFWIGIIFLCLLGLSVIELIIPLFESSIIEKVVPSGKYTQLVTILVVIAFLEVLKCLLDIYQNYISYKYEHKIMYIIRKDLFDKLQKLYFDYFDKVPSGKILVRLTTYVNQLNGYFAYYAIRSIFSFLKILLVVIFAFRINIVFTLIVIGYMTLLAIVAIGMRSLMKEKNRTHKNKNSNRVAFVSETINGNTVSNAFEKKEANAKTFKELNDLSKNSYYEVVKLREKYNAAISIIWNSINLTLYTTAFFLMLKGEPVLGAILAFSSYTDLFYDPIMLIIEALQIFSEKSVNLERMFELLDYPISVKEKENAYPLPPIRGNIKYDNITFSYDESFTVLENFSLDVSAGQMIALVGPTGAGKSTVVNLLNRFYDPNKGDIYIDGHNIKDVTTHSLRKQVGMMMQDSFIFRGTIMDNIRYGSPNATDQQCIEAARKIGADQLIENLPHGYYEKVGENGEGLSSGEKQLICFARIILNDPKVLILDEATSSIDSLTEKRVMAALDVITKGRTCFVIAHRLSTIRKADKILVINNKGIQEQGTHEQLMKLKGHYYKLVNHQM